MNVILWDVTLSPILTPSRIPKVELCFIRTNDPGVVWSAEAEAMAWRNPEQWLPVLPIDPSITVKYRLIRVESVLYLFC